MTGTHLLSPVLKILFEKLPCFYLKYLDGDEMRGQSGTGEAKESGEEGGGFASSPYTEQEAAFNQNQKFNFLLNKILSCLIVQW